MNPANKFCMHFCNGKVTLHMMLFARRSLNKKIYLWIKKFIWILQIIFVCTVTTLKMLCTWCCLFFARFSYSVYFLLFVQLRHLHIPFSCWSVGLKKSFYFCLDLHSACRILSQINIDLLNYEWNQTMFFFDCLWLSKEYYDNRLSNRVGHTNERKSK